MINWKRIILILFIVFLLLAVYLNFIYTQKCDVKDCFDIALAKCKRASYVNQGKEATWLYAIKGKQGDNCVVYVENQRLYKAEEAAKIMGKDMLCYIPQGVITSPESNIDLCHGILKEAMQDLIIEKMHVYIIQNLGKINEEAIKPI